MAKVVTQTVPRMNERNPNSPFEGCQDDERNSSVMGWVAKTKLDLWNRANAIMKTIRLEETVAKNIIALPRRSFNLLFISSPHSVERRRKDFSIM